jgi:hypothetical protein
LAIILFGAACSSAPANAPSASPFSTGTMGKADGEAGEHGAGPGDEATDQRRPELGKDPRIVADSKISLADGIRQVEAKNGKTIEAKFELDDAGKLSLSIYPVGNGIDADAERNVFQEASGDPKASPWAPGLETFKDAEHLTRSARDLTLVQLSRVSLADAVERASAYGRVYWAIPTIRDGRAGYGVYLLDEDGDPAYGFIDGDSAWDSCLEDLGQGPGDGATDRRAPELGSDVRIVRQSKVAMAEALRAAATKYGDPIEAKFELDDAGKLSLSIYPVGNGIATDAERNKFQELSGDPTAAQFAGDLSVFSDAEHLTRSARDLTLVQTSSLRLVDAVELAQAQVPGGVVYWAIPTIRHSRAGYGVYVLGADDTIHYFFIS